MEKRPTVLYICHAQSACGVYEFGQRIGKVLNQSSVFAFHTVHCQSSAEILAAVARYQPRCVIYNYHPATMPFVTPRLTRRISVPQVGTIHEVTQKGADAADNLLFDAHLAPDPTLLLRNPLVFKTGRLVAGWDQREGPPKIPVIGTFGFGTTGKGVELLVALVQAEFDVAEIRLQIPAATFGDPQGVRARAIVQNCRDLLYKPGITLSAFHDYLAEGELLRFLANNSLNVFVYDRAEGRGVASCLDYALGVGRPVAIRQTEMMRHVWTRFPQLCIENNSLRRILEAGSGACEELRREWSADNLRWDYERIVQVMLCRPLRPRPPVPARTRWGRLLQRVMIRLWPSKQGQRAASHWLSESSYHRPERALRPNALVSMVPDAAHRGFNRILDNDARWEYRQVIADLMVLLPDLMARKIPRANVQQAFVFDTVRRLLKEVPSPPRVLCVGSFEDTAFWGLRAIGISVDEVDPVVNYELSEFMQRPSTQPNSYDVVFSVSVLEHVVDDERFVREMVELVKPGGHAILTCDFQSTYRTGDHKPQADCRLYTCRDLSERLLGVIPDCQLIDQPRWVCDEPDFEWEQCRYTFATFVVKKNCQ